jgi:transcriptional regulator with XRE-family HTH domain
VGERLAALRSSHGLTQRALGEKIGQPHTYVGKLEIAERRLDILDVATLALAFAMSPAELTTYLLGAADAAEPKAQ